MKNPILSRDSGFFILIQFILLACLDSRQRELQLIY
jgi:hypothetical protein